MTKAYIVLIAILVVVVLAFTFAKSYLSRLDADDILMRHKINSQELVDSLRHTYEQMLKDNSADLQRRFDSLSSESDALIYTLESQLDLYISREYDPLQQMDSSSVATAAIAHQADEAASDLVTPSEYEIYIAYLEKIQELPKDLSSYEKQVEVTDIIKKLMDQFSLSEKDLKDVLLKLRQRNKGTTKSG